MDTATFLAGLLVGAALGLALGPLIRAVLVAREYRQAREEASMTDEVLRRVIEPEHSPPSSPRSEGPSRLR